MKLLSVIVPVYNVEQYVEKCLLSIIENDLPHEDQEIIVVDDESPDKSMERVQPIALQYPFIKTISQKNLGLGGARNTGISHAQGKYLLFLDSDDWVLPNSLKKIVDDSVASDADIYEFSAQGIDTQGKIVYHYAQSTNEKSMDGVSYYNQVRYMNSVWNKLYKTELLVSQNLFFLERIFIEDFEFNTRVFLNAKRVIATDFLVCQIVQTPNSITRNTDAKKQKKMVDDILYVLKITNDLYQNQNDKSVAMNQYFTERLGFVVATAFYQLFKNKADYSEMKELKTRMVEQNLFYIDFPLHQKIKNRFRQIFLKNFAVLRVGLFIRKLF